MNLKIIIIFIFIVIYIIICVVNDKINSIKRIKKLEAENEMLTYKMKQYKITHRQFDTRLEHSEDFMDAIKFAMTQAHPDNPNGDMDKFIRYRKLYEQLKG